MLVVLIHVVTPVSAFCLPESNTYCKQSRYETKTNFHNEYVIKNFFFFHFFSLSKKPYYNFLFRQAHTKKTRRTRDRRVFCVRGLDGGEATR